MAKKKNVIEQMIGILRTPIAQRKGITISANECSIWAEELEKCLILTEELENILATK